MFHSAQIHVEIGQSCQRILFCSSRALLECFEQIKASNRFSIELFRFFLYHWDLKFYLSARITRPGSNSEQSTIYRSSFTIYFLDPYPVDKLTLRTP